MIRQWLNYFCLLGPAMIGKGMLKASVQHASCWRKIEQRMEGSKFDPSHLPERDWLPVARRYMELRQRLSDLDRHIEDLDLAGEFGKQWATRL